MLNSPNLHPPSLSAPMLLAVTFSNIRKYLHSSVNVTPQPLSSPYFTYFYITTLHTVSVPYFLFKLPNVRIY